MIAVWGIDTKTDMFFDAKTAREAMEKALYTLNLSRTDKNATIQAIGKNGRVLMMEHCGNVYSTLADGSYTGSN